MRPARARQPATKPATATKGNTTVTPSARSTRLSRRNQANENNERRVADSGDNQNESRTSSTPTLDSDEPKTTKNKKDIGFTIIIPYKPFPRKLSENIAGQQVTSIVSEGGSGDEAAETPSVEARSTRTKRGARRTEAPSIPTTDGEVGDIEYPRQQVKRMEAAVLSGNTTLWKSTPISNTLLEQRLEEMNEESTPETISAIAEDITAVATEGLDVKSFSKLSISPPPSLPMFDLKDPDGSGNPWLMVFDSAEHFSNTRPSRLRESWDDEDTSHVPDSPSLPTRSQHTRHHQDEHKRREFESLAPVSFPKIENWNWMDEDDHVAELGDKGEEDDDPFGFSKMERRIKRAQILQPLSRSRTPLDSDAGFNTGFDSDNTFDSPRPRRRGETRNKGKGVDRTWFLSKEPLQTTIDTSAEHEGENEDLRSALELSKLEKKNPSAAVDVEDQDLKKALQLSMGIDLDGGVGSSSMASLFSHPETTVIHENASSSDIPRVRTNIASIRSIRSPSPESEPEDFFTVTEVRTERVTSPAPPSTPPRKSRSNQNRISFGDLDQSPILIERTPTKKPEAGMPASMESPPLGYKGGRRGQTGKTKRTYMRTEQLEAMLPRRKKARVMASNSKSTSLSLDTSDDEEEEEEEEPLVRRGRNRKHATAASTSSVATRKEATAKVTPSKNSSKSTTLKQTSDKKGKKKDDNKTKKQSSDDKSGWTEAQLKAHQERIRYFEEIDNFELDVETTR